MNQFSFLLNVGVISIGLRAYGLSYTKCSYKMS